MATLLLWLSWRESQPDDRVWEDLLARAQQRTLFPGVERSGPGFRLFAARTRELEPPVLVQCSAEDGSEVVLLLDRANGADDSSTRANMDWSGARLADGTPTAAARLCVKTLKLQLYRDLMGQRGLVYGAIPGGVVVASGEHILCAHPAISTEFDPGYLAAYFAGLDRAPDETLFSGIRAVVAGETLTIDAGGVQHQREPLQPDHSWRSMTDDAIVARFRELLARSVANACRGSRRVGISLSAGLDSSSIVALAARLPTSSTGGVCAVTQGLDSFPQIDERALAANLALGLGIEHKVFAADRLHPFSNPELRPICPDHPSQSPFREWKEITYEHFANAGVDVWLSGNFGDHLFMGEVEWVVDALKQRRWRLLGQQLLAQLRTAGLKQILRDTAIRRPVSRGLGRVRDISARTDWLRQPWRNRIRERLREELRQYANFPRPAHCQLLLGSGAAFDASGEEWFAQRHGMAASQPFRDVELTRWCLSLPADFSRRNGQRKWLLREAMRGLLPEALRLREKASDLTPYLEAVEPRHQAASERNCRAATVLYEKCVDPAAIAALDPDQSAIFSWLADSAGSWLLARGAAK